MALFRHAVRALFWIAVVLVGAILLSLLSLAPASWFAWFFRPGFWGALSGAAVASTMVYAQRHPPQATADVPAVRVVALHCVFNALLVAALGHLILATHTHADNIPVWLFVEFSVVTVFVLHWIFFPAEIETHLLTMQGRTNFMRRFWEEAIVPAVQGVYLLCAGSALVALLLLAAPLRWLPGWGAFLLGWLGGGIFGFLMSDAFVRLPPIKPLFEAAPINGATGTRISNADAFAPYTIVAVLGGLLLPVIDAARHRRGLSPLLVPHGVVWVPVILALLMAAASLRAYLTRDPAEAERERAEDEDAHQRAVASNREKRADLLACTDLILTAWEQREKGNSAWMPESTGEELAARLWERGIFSPLPDSKALSTANSFLTSLYRASKAGETHVDGNQPSLLLFGKKTPVLSWEEAVTLTGYVAARLRAEQPMDDVRLLQFLGQRPPRPET